MNSEQLWLFAQNLNKHKPVVSSERKEKGLISAHTLRRTQWQQMDSQGNSLLFRDVAPYRPTDYDPIDGFPVTSIGATQFGLDEL